MKSMYLFEKYGVHTFILFISQSLSSSAKYGEK